MKRVIAIIAAIIILTVTASAQSSSTAFRVRTGTTVPATCRIGDLFYQTGGTAGLYNCTATNTWTAAGGSSGANTALSNLASVAINTDLLPASTQGLGNAGFPFLTSFTGNTTQYESVSQSAGLITHALLGSATNVGLTITPKGAGDLTLSSGRVLIAGVTNATQTNFTQSLANAGILISGLETEPAFHSGIFWYATDNNATLPKVGIYWNSTSSGSQLILGTSNSYASGLTSSVTINQTGSITIPSSAGLIGTTVAAQLQPIQGGWGSLNSPGATAYLPLSASATQLFGTSNTTLDTALTRNAAGKAEVNNGTAGTFRDLLVRQHYVDQTITAAGTTGAQTINKSFGTVNIAAAGTNVTVTNNLCTTSSTVFAVIRTNDSTATIKNVVPGAGSFVVTLTAGATAEVSIGFWVVNQ